MKIPIQIHGHVYGKITVSNNATDAEVRKAVRRWMSKPHKIVVIPKKLVNVLMCKPTGPTERYEQRFIVDRALVSKGLTALPPRDADIVS